jgi:hypothetical protein
MKVHAESRVPVRLLPAWVLALLLAACGGGGGGGAADPVAADGPRLPQATVVRDENPTMARLSVGPADFFPAAAVVRSVFDRLDDGGQRLGSTTLDLTPLGPVLRAVETDDGIASETTDLRLDDAGWMLQDLRNSLLPAGAVALIGELLQYPAPFHGIGSTRVQFRSGNYGADVDADGVNESFEFEFRQTMVGYETVQGPNGPIEALRIRDELLLTVIPSRRAGSNLQARAVSDSWLARGLGLVRERVSSTGSDGRDVFAPYTLVLRSLTVDGVDPLDVNTLRDVQAVELVHRDLVFDPGRSRYYASVPGRVAGQGNRIAVIDAGTGAVSWSGVVGSEPGVMALAADGASLYVALDGSSELLRLSLPGLAEIGRMRLPQDGSFGPYVTEALAASPVEPGTVAVALAHTGLSPRHAGVLLVRDLVAQPVRTAGHTGSNVIVFGRSGQQLYGLNNETTEFGLRRIALTADGLVEQQVLGGAVGQFYLQSMDRTATGLVLGNRLYAEDSLAPLGTVADAAECRALPNAALACVASHFDSRLELLVADARFGTLQLRLQVAVQGPASRRVLVAGPPGSLAVRDGIEHPASREASRVLLLRHPAFE